MTLLSPSPEPNKRRVYSPAFKAQIVEACNQPGASLASIALKHGLNANLVHKWRRAAAKMSPGAETRPDFVPLALPTNRSSSEAMLRIELPSVHGNVVVHWPLSEAERCLTWLRTLLS
ncbi:MAG: transposase [Pseudohongiella sp.]